MNIASLLTFLELALLLAISVVDLRRRRIPNSLLALAAVLAAAASLLFQQPPASLALLGVCAGFGAFLLVARLRPGALGMGDVKLAGVIGLIVGFPQVVFALLFGMIAAGLVALALVLRPGEGRTMAYAPYLALGAAFVLLRG